MATKKAAKPKPDELDTLVEAMNADPRVALLYVLWKQRHQNPEMAVLIDRRDISGLRDCVEYLSQQPDRKGKPLVPDVMIFRRAAIPAHAAVPATKPGWVSINAFKGAPAAEHLTICVVEKGTEDTFKPIENNEEDAVRGEAFAERRRLRETLPALATQVNNQAAGGDFSRELVMEVCHGAVKLATEPR